MVKVVHVQEDVAFSALGVDDRCIRNGEKDGIDDDPPALGIYCSVMAVHLLAWHLTVVGPTRFQMLRSKYISLKDGMEATSRTNRKNRHKLESKQMHYYASRKQNSC